MTANIRLRSNVFVRRPPDVREDLSFQDQVRGHKAIRKMAAKLFPYPTEEYLKERLTEWQFCQYVEHACPHCNCQIYGQVRHGEELVYSWRRPPKYCECWEHIN